MFGNLFSIAASVIPQQTVQWLRFESREQDARGRWINTYADPVPVTGSFQAMDAKTVKEMGLDVGNKYCSLHTSHDLRDTQRGEAPDRVQYAGQTYEVIGEPGDWFEQDGWKHLHLVRIDPL